MQQKTQVGLNEGVRVVACWGAFVMNVRGFRSVMRQTETWGVKDDGLSRRSDGCTARRHGVG